MGNFYEIANFDADGDSIVFKAKSFIISVGDSGAQDYGSGTVTLYTRILDDTWKPVPDGTFTTGVNIKTSSAGLPAAEYKLTLFGSTDPDLNYTINYNS
jgi:hypothetical protein